MRKLRAFFSGALAVLLAVVLWPLAGAFALTMFITRAALEGIIAGAIGFGIGGIGGWLFGGSPSTGAERAGAVLGCVWFAFSFAVQCISWARNFSEQQAKRRMDAALADMEKT